MGDTNPAGVIAIGGSVPSGCSSLQSTTIFVNDHCAIVEQFSSYTDLSPKTYLINSITLSTGSTLGVTGLLALKLNYNADGTESSTTLVSMFGVLQLASGQTYMSEVTPSQSLTTDGTELVFFSLVNSDSTHSSFQPFWIPTTF